MSIDGIPRIESRLRHAIIHALQSCVITVIALVSIQSGASAADGVEAWFDARSFRTQAPIDSVIVRSVDPHSPARETECSRESDGLFHFVATTAVDAAALRVHVKGYFDVRLPRSTTRASAPTCWFVEAPSVRGRVVDSRGGVVAGASVRIRTNDPMGPGRIEANAVTNDDGEFTIDRPSFDSADLSVQHPRFAPLRQFEIPATASASPFDLGSLKLEDGIVVSGVVTDAEKRPIATTIVEGLNGDPRSTRCDSEGHFRFGPVEIGAPLILHADGFVAVRRAVPPTGKIEIVLESRGTIHGRVVDEFDQPLVGYTVRASDGVLLRAGAPANERQAIPEIADRFVLVAPSGTTDSNGEFSIIGLTPGEWKLRAERADSGFAVVGSARTGDDSALLRLVKGEMPVRIRGRVLSPDPRLPLESYQVSIDSKDGDVRFMTMTPRETSGEGNSGRFEAWIDRPREVTIWAGAQGFLSHEDTREVGAVGLDDLEIVLEVGGIVEGTLRDARGEPVSGARIQLSIGMGLPDPFPDFTTLFPLVCRSDSLGRFRITGVWPGEYRLYAQSWSERDLGGVIQSYELVPQPILIAANEHRIVALRDFAPSRTRVTIHVDPFELGDAVSGEKPDYFQIHFYLRPLKDSGGASESEVDGFSMSRERSGGTDFEAALIPGRYEVAAYFRDLTDRPPSLRFEIEPKEIIVPAAATHAVTLRGRFTKEVGR